MESEWDVGEERSHVGIDPSSQPCLSPGTRSPSYFPSLQKSPESRLHESEFHPISSSRCITLARTDVPDCGQIWSWVQEDVSFPYAHLLSSVLKAGTQARQPA